MAEVAQVKFNPWDHFTGTRFSKRTWEAVVVLTSGEEVPCGHAGHRTADAAINCGWRLARRLTREEA